MRGELRVGAEMTSDVALSCDVAVVGSGAGGAVLAAGLAERGLTVVLLEEGGHYTREDFDLQESTAYPMLYQDRGTRATADLAITILQGRSVGGSTTVNWTTCFRTPDRILDVWQRVHGVDGLDPGALRPHFEAVEARLNIGRWQETLVNRNNRPLLEGARKLGWHAEVLRRNVNGCANSGYCGLGCPVDGKQAMHLTYIPDGLAAGMTLLADTRAERLEVVGGRVVAVHARVLDRATGTPTGVTVTIRPKVAVSAGGAINGPALLLRSGLDDGIVGRRTFLHPVVAVAGEYDEVVDPWYGAPQSVSSHEHVDRGPDRYGFFLEAAPIHPMLAATAHRGSPDEVAQYMGRLNHISALIALSVDGLLDGDEGGTVTLRSDGRVRVDYPISARLSASFRDAHLALARVHLAAGARRVASLHVASVLVSSEAELTRLETAPYGAHAHTIFTAHQMGGCAMGGDRNRSVVDSALRHWRVPNLFVVDGSVLPTALGVNPSQTIYALAHRSRDIVAAAV